MTATTHSRLNALLNANSVAIVGASSDPTKISGRPLAYMLARQYKGELYPVNPGREEVQGLKSYPSLSAIGKPVDLAIVGTSAQQVKAVITDGIEAGVKAFVVFSSGFAETGEEGLKLQIELTRLAREHGVTILGPNCLGVANSATGLLATFTTAMESTELKQGHFAFVSQSGALGAYWLDIVLRSNIGFSHWITTGNECDIDAAEAIDFLVDDPETKVIAVYLEDIRDSVAFRRALKRAALARKPVIAIKSGCSSAGAKAAASHTGAIAGDDALYDACLSQYGALRVSSLTAMMDAARMILFSSVPQGQRLAVLSVSGGAGVMIADAAEAAGLLLSDFAEPTRQSLKAVLPDFSQPNNPLDLTGHVVQNTASVSQALMAVATDDDVDAIILFVGLLHSIADVFIEALANARKHMSKPIIVVWAGALPETIASAEAIGIPVFSDIPQAIDALASVQKIETLQAEACTATALESLDQTTQSAGSVLSEHDGKQLLTTQQAIGLPQSILVTAQTPLPERLPLEGSLVAKLQSTQLLHKSDAGGVILRIQTVEAMQEAITRLFDIGSRLDIEVQGVLLEQMQAFDHELLLGLRRDERFGPILTIARGGVEVELNPDSRTQLLPLDSGQVSQMLSSLRSAPLFAGYRGTPGIDLPVIADKIAQLCGWFMDRPDIREIEINPLAIKNDQAWALDALVTLN